MFDGLGKFPEEAEARRQQKVAETLQRLEELKKRKVSVENAEEKAIQVGIGKIVEKIVPAYRSFNLPLSDCRPLFEPIDLVVFNGANRNNVESITFLEVKTGQARLNAHQKAVKEAVEKNNVDYKEV